MFENEQAVTTEFILWNTSNKELETQFNGRFVCFAPGEKKSFSGREDVLNHVHFKLDRYGVVKLKKDASIKETQDALIAGLKARHKTLRFVVEQFQASNKAREANKMAHEAPSEYVSECVLEDQIIMDKLSELDSERTKLVQDYFKKIDEQDKAIADSANEKEEVVVTASGVSVERKRGRPRKETVNNDISSS